MHVRLPSWVLACAFVAAAAAVLVGQSAAPRLLRGDTVRMPAPACGTTTQWELNGRLHADALPNGLADGEPYMFDQDPPLLSATASALTLRNFSVVGDVPSVTFIRATRDVPDGVSETWPRAGTRRVSGQIVSLFEPSWNGAALDEAFGRRTGYDLPLLYWGALQMPGGSTDRPVFVRVGLGGIPTSPVTRIDDRAQYASDVVNLVVPTFEDARVANGMQGFDLAIASRLFYEYFADSYDVLAFTPESTVMGTFSAFHRNVQNTVSGLNLSLFNASAGYGSGGALQGVEVYVGTHGTLHEVAEHEMAHQWGSAFDWGTIAGISRAGWQPTGHSPLWTGGESLIGAVLYAERRVTGSIGSYTIEQTPFPASYHPLERYAMGILKPEQVPDFNVFVQQDQFNPTDATAPDVGTVVQGDVKAVSIGDLIRVHGPRVGPLATTWRRATVLVSRDRLASQQQMDFWNFFAQRLGDRTGTSRPTYHNFGSFARATGDAMTLQTAIVPRNLPPLEQRLDTETPSFGPEDWRGVTFNGPVAGRFAANQTVTLSGHVTATDRTDFNQISLAFWRVNDTTPVEFPASISRSGDFSVPVRFTDTQRGAYELAVYLFWPGASGQHPRGSVSTITVE